MNLSAVIFDIDDTVIDTDAATTAAVAAMDIEEGVRGNYRLDTPSQEDE